MEFSNDTHKLITERTGQRWIADATMYAAMFLVFFAFAAALVKSVTWSNENIVRPLLDKLPALPSVNVESIGSNPAVMSLLVTVLLFALVGAVGFRWWRGWNRLLRAAILAAVETVGDRVQRLEHNAVSMESVRQQAAHTDKRLNELDGRIKVVEAFLSRSPSSSPITGAPLITESVGGYPRGSLGDLGRKGTLLGKIMGDKKDEQP